MSNIIEKLCEQVRSVLPHPMEDGDDFWVIDISGGYGHFVFVGNAADADHMRAGKAEWEGACGHFWLATAAGTSARNDKTEDALRFALKHPKGVATWRNYGRANVSPEDTQE